MQAPRASATDPLFERVFPTMFQRRLVLLMVLVVLSMAVLAVKAGHLTLVKGGTLRAEAEARLVRHQWTPTVRGKVLDRKGRVLARDRAGYDLAIEYGVVSGEWAAERAREFVKRCYREQWGTLLPDQREQLVALARESYEAHAIASREELAALCGKPREELDRKIGDLREKVQRMAQHQHDAARDRELASAGARNEIVTPAMMAAIEKRASQPIREEKTAHRLHVHLADEAAFRTQFLLGEEVEITPIPGERGARAVDRVARLPGVHLLDSGEREYLMETVPVEVDRSSYPSLVEERSRLHVLAEGVASHIIGWMRDEAQKEDMDARAEYLGTHGAANREAFIAGDDGRAIDRGEYRVGDRAGASGIERGREHDLRGARGYATRQVDTGQVTTVEAQGGRDVALTIDMMLQARVQAVMMPEAGLARVQPWHRSSSEAPNPTMPDGTAINGAAVVLDIDSGEILAMVSMPEFRRSDLKDGERFQDMVSDPVATPFINRAIFRAYPPGSIVKPLILSGAVTRGDHALNQTIACNGFLLPNNENLYRCWIFKRSQQGDRWTHTKLFGHELDGPEAIMASCNVYFFTLGRKLGPEGIVDVYRMFGLGSAFGLGIGEEFAGHLGRMRGGGVEQGDAIQMGIGQGPVSWTPLHAANAYATLARYGHWMPPTIVKGPGGAPARDLKLDAAAVTAALEGLRKSVNEHFGTGNHLTVHESEEEPIFNAPGVDVWGKTGTAEAPKIYAPARTSDEDESVSDADGENPTPPTRPSPRELVREGDHSWFVVMVGPKGENHPRFVISVVMEYAGSGGKVSGPICNQIIRALQAEGYLGGGA